MAKLVNKAPWKFINNMNYGLLALFTTTGVKNIVFHIDPTKALCQDGLLTLFYQKYWDFMGEDVMNMVLNFLNNGVVPTHLNHTKICFILKKNNPEELI